MGAQRSRQPSSTEPADPDQLNVLIVDDEPTALKLLVELVRREGHQTVEATAAEEILGLLPYWTFQVAFIDHYLPGMDGLVLGEYLRRSNPDMTIALVTGAESPALARRSAEVGLLFIEKPFHSAQILAVLDSYRESAQQREATRRRHLDEQFAPPIGDFVEGLTGYFGMPNVPSRIEDRLTSVVKQALNNLRSPQRYNERERVVALAGLLAARVLGVELPRASSGLSLFEQYDLLMHEQGRRREFSPG